MDYAHSEPSKPINVHRAFMYGASAPGWGEIYAGSYIRGLITASLFIFFLAGFTWALIDIVKCILSLFFDSLKGIKPFVLPDLPFHYLAISFLGIYIVWSWAMISSVDVATERRRMRGEPPQTSVAWGVAFSWFCPGSGQLYTGSRQFGYVLFIAFLLGILSILPAYWHLFNSIVLLAKEGQLSTNNPYVLIDIIKEHLIRVNYCFGNLFQGSIKYFAIASTITELVRGIPVTDAKWTKPSIAYGAGLFGIGWLCPGSGQLLQGRDRLGYCFFWGYVGSMLLIGFLLWTDLITAKSADTLEWVSVLVQWSAMSEAPFWMIRQNNNDNPNGTLTIQQGES